jgi:hypothetical protein
MLPVRVLYLLVVLVVIVGCGSGRATPIETPASTLAPTVSAAAPTPSGGPSLEEGRVLTVWMQISSCRAATIGYCPVTKRLAALIMQIETPTNSGLSPVIWWCRCQNVGGSSTVPEITRTGATAHVTVSSPTSLDIVKVDLIMVEQGGSLLVDDTECTGRGPSTSIYMDPRLSCT